MKIAKGRQGRRRTPDYENPNECFAGARNRWRSRRRIVLPLFGILRRPAVRTASISSRERQLGSSLIPVGNPARVQKRSTRLSVTYASFPGTRRRFVDGGSAEPVERRFAGSSWAVGLAQPSRAALRHCVERFVRALGPKWSVSVDQLHSPLKLVLLRGRAPRMTRLTAMTTR